MCWLGTWRIRGRCLVSLFRCEGWGVLMLPRCYFGTGYEGCDLCVCFSAGSCAGDGRRGQAENNGSGGRTTRWPPYRHPDRTSSPLPYRTHLTPLQETHLPASQTPLPLRPLLQHLTALGATVVPISLPGIRLSLPAYYVLACAEASSTLAKFGGGWFGRGSAEEREVTRRDGWGGEVRKRVVAGAYALTAE